MKRSLIFATLAATTLAAAPAMANNNVHTSATLLASYDNAEYAPTISKFGPARAGAGAVVVIRGTKFAKGTKIRIGNRLVKPYWVSPTMIKLKVPKNAADGTISIKVPKVSRWFRVGQFDYVPPPPPKRKRATKIKTYKKNSRYSKQRQAERYRRKFMATAKVKAEIKFHNRQVTRLRQMINTATRYGFPQLVTCAKQELRTENLRHRRAMTKLDRAFRIVWNKRYRKPRVTKRPAKKKTTWSWFASATAKLNISLL